MALLLQKIRFGTHLREEEHVTDARSVREEHGETVNTDAAAGGRGEAVLQGADVVRVVVHRFIVALALRVSLSLEAAGLIVRVIELREAVRVLAADDIELEALADARIAV